MESEEQKRLDEQKKEKTPIPRWQRWGPYVSEREWGTVREDTSLDGDAWNSLPFDEAHRRAYRWGEDGIAGWCDRFQVLCFLPAFWNGADPILKERLFGLNNMEGNHGEDVKECYFYLDGLPTHAYMQYLYKYPQKEFPYNQLREENKRRGVEEDEYELVDTGIFAENRYFDIFIEYAKAAFDDTCIRITAYNRGPDPSPLHLLPQIVFRNQWKWSDPPLDQPQITAEGHSLKADDRLLASPSTVPFEYHLGPFYLHGPKGGQALFTDNEDEAKSAFQDAVFYQQESPQTRGTKAALHYYYPAVKPGEAIVLHLRLSPHPKASLEEVDKIIELRKKEADLFYDTIHPSQAMPEERQIQRQAFAGILWSKQIFNFDVNKWLNELDHKYPERLSDLKRRNLHWRHLNSMRIMLMPDKWEFPWFAAWDLAFQSLTMGLVDIDFAKEQLWLLLFEQFQHPNGQIPACEWEFSDLNPPIQSWVSLRLYAMEKEKTGMGDKEFLKRCFLKLLLNFVWWVNRVDSEGNNIFEGGFLGLDNITLIDRSLKIESGALLRQSDGTGWMAMFCLNMMRTALEIGFEDLATKFFQHFVYIAHSMKLGHSENQKYTIWNEEDSFFYDALLYPDGTYDSLKIRSLVGIIPLYATEILTEKELQQYPTFNSHFQWFIDKRKNLTQTCIFKVSDKYVLSIVDKDQLADILHYVWDPDEFRSPFGIRSLSRFHEKNPFCLNEWKICYEPGQSVSKVKGGNSNWRGPIWMPTNFLIVETLKKLAVAYGETLKIRVSDESPVILEQIADGISQSLMQIFKTNKKGVRPFWGHHPFKSDPYWNYFLFNEYFHADTGEGLGASHQTGWSALIANIIQDSYRR